MELSNSDNRSVARALAAATECPREHTGPQSSTMPFMVRCQLPTEAKPPHTDKKTRAESEADHVYREVDQSIKTLAFSLLQSSAK